MKIQLFTTLLILSSILLLPRSLAQLSIPETNHIPKEVLEQLGVDVFFSLWSLVFNEGSIKVDNSPFTILAPINLSRTSPEVLLHEKETAKEVIAHHIIMGETIRPESLLNSKVRTSLSGKKLSFNIDSAGELWVNDVRILGWTIANEGIIFALEDYLFSKEPPFLVSEVPNTPNTQDELSLPRDNADASKDSQPKPISPFVNVDWVKKEVCRNVSDSKVTLFKNILLCVEEWIKVPKDFEHLEKLPKRLLNGDFLTEFVNFLRDLRMHKYFKDYFSKMPNKSSIFKNDTFYTIIIPSDVAFQKYQPIDWGFNPFKVESFLKQVLLDAFIEGKIESLGSYKSLSGKIYNLQANAEGISFLSQTSSVPLKLRCSKRFCVYQVDALPFVSRVTLEEYKNEYGYLETGPIIMGPFIGSSFLSHAWNRLKGMKEYSYMVEYLNKTLDLGGFATDNPSSLSKEDGYTLFVPRDDAFWRLLIQDANAPDPFMLDFNFRLNILRGHLVPKRLYLNSLEDNQIIQTSNHRSFQVKINNETGIVSFHDGRQSRINVLNKNNRELWIFNLGNIIFIDRILFTETSDIIKVMEDTLLKSLTPKSITLDTTMAAPTTKAVTTTTTITSITSTAASTTSIKTTKPPKSVSRKPPSQQEGQVAPKFLKDIISPKSAPKIIYVNNKRVAILNEQDFDSLFTENQGNPE